MTLSRKDVRSWQTKHLLDVGMLPVSLDYRLYPEINIIDGAMTDIRDAIAWARSDLPAQAKMSGVLVDPSRVIAVGWSTGAMLAMSLGWTTLAADIKPPNAILAFYGPSDYEAKGTPYTRMIPLQMSSTDSYLCIQYGGNHALVDTHDRLCQSPTSSPTFSQTR